MNRALVVFSSFGLVACVVDGENSTGDVGGDGKADGAANCGKFTSDTWSAPDGCTCTGPDGETTYETVSGETRPITCEDRALQACPSTSGTGCYLLGLSQTIVSAPEIVKVHLDIGGHLHDLCCAAKYALPGSEGFETSCNGCTGGSPNAGICPSTSPIGSALDLPYNATHACAVEWNYAWTSAWPTSRWFAPLDTSLRWTAQQVIKRNMADVNDSYTTPAGLNGSRPRYGLALAPEANHGQELRAPNGTRLGGPLLSSTYDDIAALGLDANQLGSFCVSGRAEQGVTGWYCVP